MADRTKKTIFTRESTGLVKNVSLLDAISLNISNMSSGAALALIGFTMVTIAFTSGAPTSGINLVAASVIAFVLSIPQIAVYTIMTRKISRTGGDYVWVSRTYGGLFGGSLSFMGYTLETLGYLALICLSLVFAVGSVGLFFSPSSSTYLGLALPGNLSGSIPSYQFALAAIVFTLLVLINIFKPKFGYKLVSVLAVVGVVTVFVAIFTLLAAGHSGVVNYMSSLGNANLTYSAIQSTYTGSTFSFSASLFVLPFFAIFVYPWVNAAPAVASEIKGKNAMRWNVLLGSLVALIVVTGAFATMYYVGGYNFVTAALSNPTLVYNYSFNFWTLAMGVSGNNYLAGIIGIGWIVWNIAILAYGIIVFSRYLFAQAFDRFLPTVFAYVSPKYGSPVVAHVIDLVVTLGLVGAAAFFYGSVSLLFAFVIASMIYFFFIGIAAVVYGTKKDTGSTKIWLQISGILMAAVFGYIIYQFLYWPGIWGTSVTAFGIPGYDFAYIYVAVTFIVGLVIYSISKSYYSTKGIDIGLAFKEIPPE
ncbi:MAG: amino acid permease [archaeon]|nr:amino acid permease [archaeon]